MPSPPSVSVIVLNWNGKRHLDDCLGSILALNYPQGSLEVILCDNGSVDGSAEHVGGRFPTVKLVRLDRNHGFAEGNNLASESATGEWIGFLNNDMRVEPDWLGTLLGALDAAPSSVALASRILTWDGRRVDFVGGGVSFTGHGFQPDQGRREAGADSARRVLFPCGGAMLVRRDVFAAAGGFDPDYFAFFEDVDLGWRLNLAGHDVWYTPAATAYHRHHATADQLPAHRLRVLYERNALFTIYKCFDAENLAAALPAALYLLNERALDQAGLDRSDFRLDSAGRSPKPRARGRAYAYDPAAPAAESLAGKARTTLREQGLRPLLRKGTRYAGWKGGETVAGALQGATRWALPERSMVPDVALANWVAVSEFAHSLGSLAAKREAVQAGRMRSDAELFPLFVDPLRPSYTGPDYLRFFNSLVGVLGLDRRFAG